MNMKLLRAMFFGCLLLVPVVARGEVSKLHQTTAACSDSRFEIVQSQLAARWTFRLDRFTGEVMQLLLNAEQENVWAKVPVQDMPKIKPGNVPRFQIFTSGLAARHTFLLDTLTGKTWTLIFGSIPTKDGETEAIIFRPFQ